MKIENYFQELERKVKVVYDVAEQARKKGLDPQSKVEVPLATSLAERVAGLISTIYPQLNNPQLINRIKELEKEYGSLEPAICFKIAEEIAKEKLCKFKSLLEGIDAGLRIAFAYLTLGVVAAPLEGYTHLKLKKTKTGEDYFSAYFSGPIGGAGRTAASIFLIIVDYLRETFGYAKYDATEEEVKRAVTEIYDRHERVSNMQYLPCEKEIEFLVRNLPIQLDGDPTEEKEVSNYKDLERIETNRIRSGFCLILGEGIAQKAPKALKALKI
ncbi:MAG: DNA polymerase II large subunit, partial [Nanoarchaeota archaeon]